MPPGEDPLAPVRQPPEEQRPLLRLKAQQADEILAAAGAVLLQISMEASRDMFILMMTGEHKEVWSGDWLWMIIKMNLHGMKRFLVMDRKRLVL